MTQLVMNPYLESKKLWNEIYGSLENKLFKAQIVIYALCAVIVVTVGGLLYVATRSHIVPYVVSLRGNELITVNELKSDEFKDLQPKLAMNLSRKFIQQIRDRTLDTTVNNDNRVDAYSVASGVTSAKLKTLFDEQALDKSLIKIEFTSLLQKSNNTIEIRWKESKFDKTSGIPIAVQNYTSDLTYEFSAVSLDPVIASHNPLGFYVTSIHWSEDLTIESK